MGDNINQPEHPGGLLDAIVVIAEWWKTLLLVPLVAGALAYGWSQYQPTTYQSVATLLMLQTKGPLFSRDVVIEALNSIKSAPDVNKVINGLKRVGTPVQSNGRVFKVSVALELDKQELPPVILSAILKVYEDRFLRAVQDDLKSPLQLALNAVEKDAANHSQTIDQLRAFFKRNAAARTEDMLVLMTTLAPLLAGADERERKKAEIVRQMGLLPEFLVIDPPSSAIVASAPRTATLTFGAIVGAGLIVLVLIFLRDILRRQAMLPGGGEKVGRIRRAFGLR